jgi:hypothetical protein
MTTILKPPSPFMAGQLIRRSSQTASYCWQVNAHGDDLSQNYVTVYPDEYAVYLRTDSFMRAGVSLEDRDIILYGDIMLSADLTTGWELVTSDPCKQVG